MKIMTVLLSQLLATAALAGSSQTFLLDGHVDNADGSPVAATSAAVVVQIKSPAPSECILWAESQTVTLTKGDFSVEIGIPANRLAAAAGGAATSFSVVFLNNPGFIHSSAICALGSTYTPSTSDDRVISATVTPNGGTSITLANMPIKSAPYALQAQEIAGYGIMNLMKVSGAGSSVVFSPAEAQSLKDLLGGDINWDLKNRRLMNVASPTAANDATNKAYVDAAIAGAGGGGGSVTSVSGIVPISVASGTTSPVISIAQAGASTSGYLSTADWNTFNNKQAPFGTQTQNLFFASPTSGSGTPTFRGLVAADHPALDAGAITTGVFGTARLGSGAATGSNFLRGDGSWATVAGDNLGNHTATANLNLASYKLVGAGGTNGISIDASGKTGVGTNSPNAQLDVLNTNPSASGVRIQAAGGQSYPILDIRDGGGSSLSGIDAAGHFYGPDGSAAGPAYSFFNSLNTGFFAPAGGNLAVTTNGSERIRIDGGGNVGVGTTAPGEKLDVNGALRVNGDILLGNSSVACAGPRTGAIRYNNGLGTLELCDGTVYKTIPAKNAMYIAGNTLNSSLTTSYTYYSALMGQVTLSSTGFTSGTTSTPVTRGGIVRGLFVKLSQSIGGSWVFTITKNGVITGLTCTATGTNYCSDPSSSFSVTAGDDIGIKIDTGSGGAAARLSWALELESP